MSQGINTRLRIVAADDEPEMLAYYQRLIPVFGHQVDGLVGTGHELVDMCRHKSPDLVISDIRMPGMSGLDAVRQIQSPFVLVSAEDEPPGIRQQFSERLITYLTKPINRMVLKDLFDLLQRLYTLGQFQISPPVIPAPIIPPTPTD